MYNEYVLFGLTTMFRTSLSRRWFMRGAAFHVSESGMGMPRNPETDHGCTVTGVRSLKDTPTPVDFLCVGAQRSGTSWLSRNLRSHPGIWIPPCKEVHYFTRSTRYHSPSHLECRHCVEKFFGRSQSAQTWRWLFFGHARSWLARAERAEKLRRIRWIAEYFFGTVDDDWYFRLFRDGTGKIRGELTPDYALLEADDVARIAGILPNLRVILLMRDPVDRVLSQLRYHMDGRAIPDLGGATDPELVNFATASGQILRGNYPRVLAIWQQFFPADQIHLVFYEDICRFPADVLAGIFRFLGVEPSLAAAGEQVSDRANASTSHPLSPWVIRQVAQEHAAVVSECARVFGGHAEGWLKSCRRRMNAAG